MLARSMASSSSLQRSSVRSGTAAAACSPVLAPHEHDEEAPDQLRRGPWTVDEDLTLVNYIADHGEGRWNSLARAAGLKRTGKSCRLRWLNYLRPDLKRGNFTADEQLLILDLHSRWGNRWSKIAQHLPGRTDNEIKNYWRTRVQKHAKQLNCDANSNKFKDAMRYLWMPRLATDHRLQHAVAPVIGSDHIVPESAASVYDTGSSGLVVSSSLDSFTLEESSSSYDRGLCIDVHAGDMLLDGGGHRWMNEGDQGLWSESTQSVGQFQDSDQLTGWVQGFSEGLTDNFWSLEDIWKMQE